MVNPHIGVPLEEYIRDNEKLIWHVVHRFERDDKEDLFQEAAIGFVKSYRVFDSNKTKSFSTLAVPYMFGSIQRYIRDKSNLIRKPRSVYEVWAFAAQNDLDYDDIDELMELSGLGRRTVTNAMASYQNQDIVSIDRPAEDEEGKEFAPTANFSSFYEDFSEIESEEFIGELNKKQRNIVYLEMQGYTQREIAEKMDFSQPHISRLRGKIKQKAKEFYGKVECYA